MKLLFINTLLFLFSVCGYSQNLVPNSSFEDSTGCPFGSYQIDKVVSWSSAGGSPDYFNACASSGGASVPTNFCGYQNAASGNAYVGLYTFNKGVSYPNNREYIQASLISPLSIGSKYYVSFDVSFTLDNIEIGYAADKLGALFTNVLSYDSDNPPVLSNNSQVYIDTIISDTLNWFHFEGSFIADSAYQKILVGNFFSDLYTDTFEIDNSLYTAYYFIDNVCVSSDSTDCLLIENVNMFPSSSSFEIFPNPSNSGFVYLQLPRNLINTVFGYSIINSVGQTVFSNSSASISDIFKINVSTLPHGVYFIRIREGQNQWTKKLFIN